MSRPITLRYGLTDVTAQPARHKAIREALAAIKTPSVKAFRAAQMRKQDKRVYPRFIEGQSTASYVERYQALNRDLCLTNEGFFQPLGTSPQYTPIFDGVEEPLNA